MIGHGFTVRAHSDGTYQLVGMHHGKLTLWTEHSSGVADPAAHAVLKEEGRNHAGPPSPERKGGNTARWPAHFLVVEGVLPPPGYENTKPMKCLAYFPASPQGLKFVKEQEEV